jgi:hypothetical protein
MSSLTWLNHRRGVATIGTAALLIGGIGLAPAFSSTSAPSRASASHVVFTGCLDTSGSRVVFNIARRPEWRKACPAGSVRVSWNAKGRRGATGADGSNGTDGVNGAPGAVGASGPAGTAGAAGSAGADGTVGTDGTNGTDGSDGSDGSDGANGTDGATGPAGPGSMVSSGVFTLQASNQFPDTHAYLPLSGALSSEFVAPVLDQDAEVTEAEHTSMEQVIAQDETITDIVANFGSTTDLGGHLLTVELTLLVSSGGTDLLAPAAGCIFAVDGNGPTSNDCSLSPEQALHLNVGDVAVMYIHPYTTGWEPNSPIEIYGTVALTL